MPARILLICFSSRAFEYKSVCMDGFFIFTFRFSVSLYISFFLYIRQAFEYRPPNTSCMYFVYSKHSVHMVHAALLMTQHHMVKNPSGNILFFFLEKPLQKIAKGSNVPKVHIYIKLDRETKRTLKKTVAQAKSTIYA